MPTLSWIGKEKVINHHTEVPFRVLEHKYGYQGENPSCSSETHSGNKIIHGDNLEALKALLPEYEGKINCVYIDPPYNTGKEGWVYNDNVNDPHIRKWLGEIVGIEGEDLTRHDKWACMIVPRLRLIERLMTSTASLVISISYHELHTLLCICREMFSNKQIVPVTIQTSGGKPAGGFNYLHEYLVFVVNKDFDPNLLDFCGGTPRRPFEGLTLSTFTKENRPNQAFPIFVDPITESLVGVGKSLQEMIDEGKYNGEKKDYVYDFSVAPEGCVAVWPITSKGKECVWRQIPSRVKSDWEKGYIKVIKNKNEGNPNIFSIQYLPEGLIKKINKGLLEIVGREGGKPTLILGDNETEGSSIPTIWTEKDFYTVKGTNALKEILPENSRKFDYPKAPQLITSVLQAISKEDDIILDSFAGSGTTGQAVLTLNNEDGGNRKFILIEMMDYAETITAERVKRIISGYPYKSEVKEEIYSKKLTLKDLAQGADVIKQAERAIEDNKNNYNKISKPKITDNCLKVIGTKIYDSRKDGLGGSFDYYELGEPLFHKDGYLNEAVGIDKIRSYIYFSETHNYLARKQDPKYPFLLDYHDGTGYFFYYKANEISTLSHDTLNIVPTKADHYVIYADVCAISKEQLAQLNITFKKIPRDINRF